MISYVFMISTLVSTGFILFAPQAALAQVAQVKGNVASNAPLILDSEQLRKARQLQGVGKMAEAYDTLVGALGSETMPERRALYLFALGDIAFHLGKLTEARGFFQKTLENGSRFEDYVRFQLGLAHVGLNEFGAAKKQFESILDSKATMATQFLARQELAKIAIEERNLTPARRHLAYLQKRRRFSQEYPEVLYFLVRADRKLGQSGSACRWARELYTKYPSHPLVADWTMDMSKARVDGQLLGCRVTVGDKQTRIKRLQWAGESARALTELQELKREAAYLGDYTFDSLMAQHLMHEGTVDEALRLLVKHYDIKRGDSGYLMQLGRVASRASEYQVAVGAFYRAYSIAPRSRNAKTALFQAAFMSYQFQDYDGAARKFEQFTKAFPRSGLSRDSGWHMAWIRYLKGDYQGAYNAFSKIAVTPGKKRVRRGRRWIVIRTDPVSAERIRYWKAMSLLKLGKKDEARPIFQTLARDAGLGYYSVVAWYRLQAMGEKDAIKNDQRLTSNGLMAVAGDEASDARAPASREEDESEEALQTDTDAAPGEGGAEATAEAGTEPDAGTEGEPTTEVSDSGDGAAGGVTDGESEGVAEKTLTAQFDDPYLARRFERARDLTIVGRPDLARQELLEIERRTRSADDRRKLMTEYQAVDNYNRPSYISEIGFAAERVRSGISSGRQLWEFAFPRAFEKTAVSHARSFGVPVELVWSIMRAESQYRPEVQSPVGALGLMQIMPFTGRKVAELLSLEGFDTKNLLVPETNIRVGARYLQRLFEKFSGSVPLIAASYNAGPHRVQTWLKSFGLLDMDEFIEHIPFIETRNYAKKVVRYYQIYNMLYNGAGFRSGRNMAWLVKPVGVRSRDSDREVW